MPRKPGFSRSKYWKHRHTTETCSNLTCNVQLPFPHTLDILRRQIQSYGILPCGWVVNNLCGEYIQLCNFRLEKPDVVFYSLKITKNLTWILHLCGQKVISKKVAQFPPTIYSIDALLELISGLDQDCNICIGNPDATFEPLVQARNGIFTNAKGEVVAEMDGQVSKKATIRHKRCEFVLHHGHIRCSNCESHRKSLYVMLKRLENNSSGTSISSHTNYRYLSSTMLKQRASNLHRQYELAMKRIARLKLKVKTLVAKKGVQVTEELHGDLRAIMRNNFASVARKYPPNSFQRVFWEQHANASSCKSSRGNRWHPAMIRWCLYLRHLSGKAYECVRNSGVLQLPSQRTLRDYTHYVPATMGFSSSVDQMLMDMLKVKSCPPHHLYVQMLMDEMHIKEGLVYNKHSGELVGFVDLGDVNNHLSKLEKSLDTKNDTHLEEPLAKSMLVLMLRGLLTGFQFPYAQFPTSSLKGEQLYNIFWDAVQRLERIDIKVLGVTCDGYSVNRRFLKLHDFQQTDSITHKFVNPFSPDKRDIYFISDPPHLIKTVRNGWASKKRTLWCNGKHILWEHLVDLYTSGTGADRFAPGLSLVKKIKYEHIYLTSYSKMRVDLAAQVLSESVANALRASGRTDVDETIKFVSYFDKFFDAVNVMNLNTGRHNRKQFQFPYTSASDARLSWLKNDFLKYLDEWQSSVYQREGFSPAAKFKMQLSQETLLGIKITTLSFIDMVKYLFSVPGVKFFLSEKISQDPVEKFFGCQRQRGSSNENPTVYEASKNTQALRVINTVCRNVTSRGNTRGNPGSSGDINLPLKKRPRNRKKI